MIPRLRSFIIFVCVFGPLLAVVFFVSGGNRHTSDAPANLTPAAAPTSTAVQPVSELDPAFVTAPPISIQPDGEALDREWMTDAKEPQVLWQEEGKKIFIQDHHLYFTLDGVAKQALYEWKQSQPARAWLNGEYLLIGTQLAEGNSETNGDRGSWVAVRIVEIPVVIAERGAFFGPREVRSVELAKEPGLFFVKWQNASSLSESVFDLSRGEWVTVEGGGGQMDSVSADSSGRAPEKYELSNLRVYRLAGGSAVYAFTDEASVIVYYRQPYYFVGRFMGYELLNVKQVSFLDDSPHMLGLFRNEAGEEVMSFFDYELRLLPVDARLWEGDWQALDAFTFTHVSTGKLEVIRYKDGADPADNLPQYTQLSTNGFELLAAKGSLLEYEVKGQKRSISWYDLINTESAEGGELWSSPLQDFADVTIKHEDRPPWDGGTSSRKIPAWSFEDYNTNAPVSESLLQALSQAHREEDYSYAKTFRKLGAQWFVLMDREFYEYKAGALVQLGEMPITLSAEVGEASGGLGARDFVRIINGWIVADTEASRVLKLNDKLEIEAELAVPTPYRLTLKNGQLQIASLTRSVTVDTGFKHKLVASQPFASTVKMKKEMFDFQPQQWYQDVENGLIWYYLQGFLYQYDERNQKVRSFYLGTNENARGRARILPYGDELVVLLDHRLERFDRQGNWLRTLAFPRSRPDGIYDRTPQGENSLVVDQASGLLYMVQGYRILGIDLKRNEAGTIFRQNYADIGELIEHEGSLYFVLHPNQNDFYWYLQEGEAAARNMQTEIVRIDGQTHSLSRFVIEGYYETLQIVADSGEKPHFVLRSYN